MLAEERFSLILDLLARQRTATVQELCEAERKRIHHPARPERAGQAGQTEQGARRGHPAGQPLPH